MSIFSGIVDNNDNTEFWLQSELLGDNIFSDDLERDLLPNLFDEKNQETNNAEDKLLSI